MLLSDNQNFLVQGQESEVTETEAASNPQSAASPSTAEQGRQETTTAAAGQTAAAKAQTPASANLTRALDADNETVTILLNRSSAYRSPAAAKEADLSGEASDPVGGSSSAEKVSGDEEEVLDPVRWASHSNLVQDIADAFTTRS